MTLNFVSMLPCGMVTPFRRAVQDYLDAHPGLLPPEASSLEANVNHEKSYYPALEACQSAAELPDILIASDIGNQFHRAFRQRFVESGVFEEFLPHGRNPQLQQAGFFDPSGDYTMYSANLLVLVADYRQLGARRVPRRWEDLLDPQYRNLIAIRGDEDFFCNGVLIPLAHRFGMDAMSRLAPNVREGMHPAQMAKLVGSGKPDSPAVYVMPQFFADKIVHKDAMEVVWPEEGAIPSPVVLLVKREAVARHGQLLDYLTSHDLAEVFTRNGFPSAHPGASDVLHGRPLFWVGWDFLAHEDVGAFKASIQRAFAEAR